MKTSNMLEQAGVTDVSSNKDDNVNPVHCKQGLYIFSVFARIPFAWETFEQVLLTHRHRGKSLIGVANIHIFVF